jgi:hypothetical protein
MPLTKRVERNESLWGSMHSFQASLMAAVLFASVSPTASQQRTPTYSSIEGLVVDATTGDPIDGVLVHPSEPPVDPRQPDPPPDAPRTQPLGLTNPAGRFSVGNIATKNTAQFVTFSKAGYIQRSVSYTFAAAAPVRNVVVRLTREGVISGRALNNRGEPAVNVSVWAYHKGTFDLVRTQAVRTNDRGEFRMSALPPDRYIIGYMAPNAGNGTFEPNGEIAVIYPGVGNMAQAEHIEVAGNETRLKDVVLGTRRLGAIRVQFDNTGEPGKDAELVFEGSPAKPIRIEPGSKMTTTYWPNRLGSFDLTLRWSTAAGKAVSIRTPVSFTGGDAEIPLVAAEPTGVFRVRGFTEQPDGTRTPLSGSRIGLCPANVTCSLINYWISGGFSLGSDGTANVTGIAPGNYLVSNVRVPEGSYVASVRQGERDALIDGIRISAEPSDIVIGVRPGAATIRGRVLDRDGKTMEGIVVTLIPEPPLDRSKLFPLRRSLRSDQNGFFEHRGFIPGRYRIYALSGVAGNAHEEPEVLTKFRDLATIVQVREGESLSLDLRILN